MSSGRVEGAADFAGADSLPTPLTIRTVAVIGAGSAGRSFALLCATAGFDVVIEDVMPANLRRAEEEYAGYASVNDDSGSLKSVAQGTTGRLQTALTIEGAVRTADVAVDFVPDELESKLEIFCLIDRMAPPKTILLTPSDAMSITDLASCTYRGDRCFAVRGSLGEAAPGFPVRLLHPLGATAPALSAVEDFLRALGGDVQAEIDPVPPMLVKNRR